MNFELFTLIGYIGSLFVLYRLLVKNYEKQINILKDELEYKQNYKHKLEEYKVFYEEDVKLLKKRLTDEKEQSGHRESQIREAEERISEINVLLAQESAKRSKIEDVMERVHSRYRQQLEDATSETKNLQQTLDGARQQYSDLVLYVKKRYGQDALLKFHYSDDSATQLKYRHRLAKEAKYKKENTK